MKIRTAVREDAIEVSRVVRMSIEKLCMADHQGDKAILERWLANKTPETVARWLTNPDNINLVAVDDSEAILGSGVCGGRDGEGAFTPITSRLKRDFCGVSNALLAALRRRGPIRRSKYLVCALESTKTAHRFYQERGYSDVGEPGVKFGLTTFPMRKRL